MPRKWRRSPANLKRSCCARSWQDIRKPVLASAEGDPAVNGIYSDMINNQLADSISHSGGFGLAKSLTSQLTHQVLPNAPSAQAPAPAHAAPLRAKESRPSLHD